MTSSQPSQNGKHTRNDEPADATGEPTVGTTGVASIPLTADSAAGPDGASMGELVREASTHVSALFRAELELAKAEVTAEAKKGLKGSIFFLAALTVLFFSVFFLFLAGVAAVDIVLPLWAAFLVVFGFMALIAGVLALLGYLRVRTIHKPERTIRTVQESRQAFAQRGSD